MVKIDSEISLISSIIVTNECFRFVQHIRYSLCETQNEILESLIAKNSRNIRSVENGLVCPVRKSSFHFRRTIHLLTEALVA